MFHFSSNNHTFKWLTYCSATHLHTKNTSKPLILSLTKSAVSFLREALAYQALDMLMILPTFVANALSFLMSGLPSHPRKVLIMFLLPVELCRRVEVL